MRQLNLFPVKVNKALVLVLFSCFCRQLGPKEMDYLEIVFIPVIIFIQTEITVICSSWYVADKNG